MKSDATEILIPINDRHQEPKRKKTFGASCCCCLIMFMIVFLFYPRYLEVSVLQTVYYPKDGISKKLIEVYNPNFYPTQIKNLEMTQYFYDCRNSECSWTPSWTDSKVIEDTKIGSGKSKQFILDSNTSNIVYLTQMCLMNGLYIKYKGKTSSNFGINNWEEESLLIECSE